MALKTVLADIAAKKAAYEAAMNEAGATLQASIVEALAEALRQTPEQYLQIRWTQYTPSFNDGDPCTFRMGEAVVQDEECQDETHDGYWYSNWRSEEGHPELKPVDDVFSGIDEDVMEHAFGDGVKVTIRRDGTFDIDDYYCGY